MCASFRIADEHWFNSEPATEFTMMIRLASADLFEVLPVLCGCRGWPLPIVT
jgi:hypothetical protein